MPSNSGFQLVKITFYRKQLRRAVGLDLLDISQELPQLVSGRRDLLGLKCRPNVRMGLTKGREVDHVAGQRSVAHLPTRFVTDSSLDSIEKILLARLAEHQPIQSKSLLELFVAACVLAVGIEEQVSANPLHLAAPRLEDPVRIPGAMTACAGR